MCDLHVCRICLNTGVKGYQLEKYSLRNFYENVMRQKLNTKDGLPQWVCYECAMMLLKYHKFKEKCLQGQRVLRQISLRGKITYKSVGVINRYSENLISSVGIAIVSKHVKTTTFKSKCQWKRKAITRRAIELDDKCSKNTPHERVEIKSETKLCDVSEEENVGSGVSNMFDDIQNTNIGTGNNNINLDTNMEQHEVKYENTNETTTQTTNPLKAEIAEGLIKKHLNSIVVINNTQNSNNDKEKASKSTDNIDSDIENTKYDSDNFDNTDHANAISSEDESLADTVKKRGKVKHKSTYSEETEPKVKKSKTETDKVELKNTKPNKHILNPQFWKKISLNEEEAVREFKRREFDNDYYLKAKYKCQNCFKGFSKNDMLVRHLKHWHDESSGQAECRFCHMRFRLKYELVKHMKEHLILHQCLQCNLQFSRLQAALSHQAHHNGIKRTCEHCGKEFNHLSTYYTHVRMSHRSSHVCVACGASFVSEVGLLQHTKLKHFDDMCDRYFPSRHAYKKHHQAEHSHIPLDIPRDICEICGASVQLGSISYHMKSHTGEREFACPAPACGMRFTLKANMNRHYNVKHLGITYPKYIRKTPGRRKKKTQEILDNDSSPFVKTRTGYFL